MRFWCFVAVAAVVWTSSAGAQMAIPSAPVQQDGGALFRNQCATCHTLNPADPPRMGPLLKGVVGRRVGSVTGFKYSDGYHHADWDWDEAHLDTYLTNPQAMIPGSVMLYRQANPETRKRIIAYLTEQK